MSKVRSWYSGSGGFDTLSLSSGVEIHPRVRVGLSLNRWFNGFSQVVNRPNAQTGGYRRISSTWDISGTNFNLGALLTPTSRLNLGVVYKTPFAADVRLSKAREDLPLAVDGDTGLKAEPEVVRHQGDVQIRFPRVYGFGASYRASNTLTFSADFTRTAWSQATITDFFSLGGAFSAYRYGDDISEYTYNVGPRFTPVNKPNDFIWGIGYNHGGVFNKRDANPLVRFGPTNFQIDSIGTDIEHWVNQDFRYRLGYYYSRSNVGVNGSTFLAGLDYHVGEGSYLWLNYEYGNFLAGRVAPGLFSSNVNNYILNGGVHVTF